MTTVVFAGPSIYGLASTALVGVEVFPPAACGDVARAVRDGASAVGLIDGCFESAASVWHKELLWVLSKGIRLYGSSSMGALRAAETWQFGMQGVGAIYRLYRCGAIIDDDEVALLHGPPELRSVPLTEAMVNIRATLRAARRQYMITPAAEAKINEIAKSLFYKDRTYRRVLEVARTRPELGSAVAALEMGLGRVHRDLKRDDAELLLRKIRASPACVGEIAPVVFPRTSFWDAFESRYLVSTHAVP